MHFLIETLILSGAVERKDGKRMYNEYQAKYTFYYEDPRGKYKSIFGDQLQRVVCKNTLKTFVRNLLSIKARKCLSRM